jgi:hypothetical protein
VRESRFNPYVLPLNYNFRPRVFQTVFAPVKIWHEPFLPGPELAQISAACESGQRPVSRLQMRFNVD